LHQIARPRPETRPPIVYSVRHQPRRRHHQGPSNAEAMNRELAPNQFVHRPKNNDNDASIRDWGRNKTARDREYLPSTKNTMPN